MIHQKMQAVDIDLDAVPAKRLRRTLSDSLQDNEELSFYGSVPKNSESGQVVF